MSVSGEAASVRPPAPQTVRLFLCGDLMTGRGIDQVLAHPCDPALHESYVRSAIDYVRLAEEANGPIPRGLGPAYIWGVALEELGRARPDARIVNLETSITRSDEFVPKGINYRMSPENAGCLAAAGIDCCVLANNHVRDWGISGLLDTLATLERLNIKVAGAGRNRGEAALPAVLDVAGKGRVLVFSFASPTSGTPADWAATRDSPGVNFLPDLSDAALARICEQTARVRQPHDVIVVSIHWGPNWGYEVPGSQTAFARGLIDKAGASIVHGHSSHHPKGMEVYRDHLILYGCGDFLNDYEGIERHAEYRDDLPLMYFPEIDPSRGDLIALETVPLQIRRFRLTRPVRRDVTWLQRTLDRESERFGARVTQEADWRLALTWAGKTTHADRAEPGRARR
jgi:poly-gamma-glutamate synthesis protein (capsule biosynthesis protein)